MRRPTKIIDLKYIKSNYMQLNTYKKYIEELASDKRNKVFFNSGKEHAVIVLSSMFKRARKSIKIYAGNMLGGIANNQAYIDAINDFLARQGKIEILLEEYDEENEPVIFKTFRRYYRFNPNQIVIKKHIFSLSEGTSQFTPIHFCVVDGRMYRIEKDIVNFAAQGNFNDIGVSTELANAFDKIFNDKTSRLISLSEIKGLIDSQNIVIKQKLTNSQSRVTPKHPTFPQA